MSNNNRLFYLYFGVRLVLLYFAVVREVVVVVTAVVDVNVAVIGVLIVD